MCPSSKSTSKRRKKAVTTANPDYPSGKRRRDELYSTFVSGLSPLTPGELEQVREVGLQNSPAYTPALWQVDPLDSEEGCAARASAIASSRPLMPSEEYVVHRSFTKALVSSPGDNSGACEMAAQYLAEFRRRQEAAM
jgi:hypothetical protein